MDRDCTGVTTTDWRRLAFACTVLIIVFRCVHASYGLWSAVPLEVVLTQAKGTELEYLRANDQLNLQRAAHKAFEGFEEGVLTFPPTYKYQPGADVYEERPDKKKRAPAWCDRVLWRVQRNSIAGASADVATMNQCTLVYYGRSEQVCSLTKAHNTTGSPQHTPLPPFPIPPFWAFKRCWFSLVSRRGVASALRITSPFTPCST